MAHGRRRILRRWRAIWSAEAADQRKWGRGHTPIPCLAALLGRARRELRHLDDAAGYVAVAVAVEEIEDEADDRPDGEQRLRFQVEVDEQQDASGDRERRDDVERRSPEG